MQKMTVFFRLFEIVVLVAWLALISLPGIGVTCLGWRLSRNMRPIFVQAVFRAGLIAIAITPSIWGHGGILPAIFLAFVLQGRERLAGIVPILVVWTVSIPVLAVRGRKQTLKVDPHVGRQESDSSKQLPD
jgi:hypothetical protein